jgi:hypothetical protein
MKKFSSATIMLVIAIFINLNCAGMYKTDNITKISEAQAKGNTVIIVAYKKNNDDKQNALKKANSVLSSNKNISVIELDITSEDNKLFVKKFGLRNIDKPAILIVDKYNNLIKVVLANQITADNLKNSIPTPTYSEIIRNINRKKVSIIVVYNSKATQKDSVTKLANSVHEKLKNTSVISVNTESEKEKNLVNTLQISNIKKATIIVINTQGQITGVFDKTNSVSDIVSAATKVISSGCGAGCGK